MSIKQKYIAVGLFGAVAGFFLATVTPDPLRQKWWFPDPSFFLATVVILAVSVQFLAKNVFAKTLTAKLNSVRWPPFLFIPFVFGYAAKRYLQQGLHFENIDLQDVIHPLTFVFHQQLRNGEVPVWNPLIGGGQPMLAFGYYPLTQFSPLFLLFGYDDATYLISLLISYATCVLTMAILLRKLGYSQAVAVFGGLLYLGAPYVGQYVLHVVHANCIGFAPFLVFAIIRYGENPSRARWACMTLALALMLLGAKLDLWIYAGFLFIFCWAYWVWPMAKRQRTRDQELLKGFCSILLALVANSLALSLGWLHLQSSSRLNFEQSFGRWLSPNFWWEAWIAGSESPYVLSAIMAFALSSTNFVAKKFSRRLQLTLWVACHETILGAFINHAQLQIPGSVALVWAAAPIFVAVALARQPTLASESIAVRFDSLLFPLWLALFFFQNHTPAEQLEMTVHLAPFQELLFIFFLLPNFLPVAEARNRMAAFFRFGFLLILFIRYHGQQFLIQVLGIVWHPQRDNFLIFLFLIAASCGLLRWKNVVFRFGLIVWALLFIGQQLLFNPRLISERGNKNASINPYGESPDVESCLGKHRAAIHRLLILPSSASFAQNPWTSQFPFNPNALQYLGIPSLTYYDSIAPANLSNLINKLNFGDRFVLDNPSVNHSFPQMIMRFFPAKYHLLVKNEAELMEQYSYLRLVPLTLNSGFLRRFSVDHILLEAPVESSLYDHLHLTTQTDRKALQLQCSFQLPKAHDSGVITFYLYKNAISHLSQASFVPLEQIRQVENQAECINSFMNAEFLRGEEAIVQRGHLERGFGIKAPVLSADAAMEPNEIIGERFVLENNEAGIFVIPQLVSPLWKVRVNGKEVAQGLVNCGFSGVFLAPGKNIVDFYLQPFFSPVLACLMGLAWCGLLALMGVSFSRLHWRRASGISPSFFKDLR